MDAGPRTGIRAKGAVTGSCGESDDGCSDALYGDSGRLRSKADDHRAVSDHDHREKAAKKLRKQAPLSTATFYCVKRKVDAPKRVAVPKKKPAPAVAQPAAAVPVGMPREFYTGTTAKQ